MVSIAIDGIDMDKIRNQTKKKNCGNKIAIKNGMLVKE